MKLKALFLLTAALAFISCSVKEEREDCPCLLRVDLNNTTKIISEAAEDVLVTVYCPDTYYRKTIRTDYFPDYLEIPVPRGQIVLSVLSARDYGSVIGKNLLINAGNQSDSVYAYSSTVDTRNEYVYEKVRLHKQYSTVFLKLTGLETNLEDENQADRFELTVRGQTSGLKTDVLTPFRGEFNIKLENMVFGETRSFRIPRQIDKSLLIELYDKENDKIFDIIPLGKHIDDTGYDWDAEDLDDIYIELEYSRAETIVRLIDWEDGKAFNEII